jgi:dUTP pyrophosphatase
MTAPVRVPVQRVDATLPLPAYARPGDAGLDLHAAEGVTLAPGERMPVRTGLALAIPAGFAGLVLPRSGLALRHGLTMVNTPGLIDSGFRGEVQVLLVNLGQDPVTVKRGDRIAQLVVQRVEHVMLVPVAELPESARGAGGFGSTGV